MAEQMEMVPTTGDEHAQTQGGLTRRTFVTAMGFATLAAFPSVRLMNGGKKAIIADAKGVLFHDTTKCVACRRCEVACTEFNDGYGSTYHARVKVGRNFGISSSGGFASGNGLEGKYGNFRMVADTCKQCPHPVYCAEACPVGAIVADSATGARVVNTDVCIGCGICTTACPWKMPTLHPVTGKSTKCHLCGGKPECARACVTGAIRYLSWRDLRGQAPVAQASLMPGSTTTDCTGCHS